MFVLMCTKHQAFKFINLTKIQGTRGWQYTVHTNLVTVLIIFLTAMVNIQPCKKHVVRSPQLIQRYCFTQSMQHYHVFLARQISDQKQKHVTVSIFGFLSVFIPSSFWSFHGQLQRDHRLYDGPPIGTKLVTKLTVYMLRAEGPHLWVCMAAVQLTIN